MSFYDNNHNNSDDVWSAPGRQPSWEQQPPPPSSQSTSRSASIPAISPQHESNAFALQFEEIDRATDNLIKSGKWQPGPMQSPASGPGGMPPRRESMPASGRGFEHGPEHRSGSRHQSVSDFESSRPGSAGLQGFYQGQRFPGGRQSEAEQVLQAKRRMAAQRERELRNYHQEQQYNRTVSGVKSDRSMSPTTMSEEDRRELIARQHRALYGDNSTLYNADGSRSQSQDARVSSGHGPSALAFDPFGQSQPGSEGAVQMPPRDRADAASPVSNQSTQQTFQLMNDAQQSNRTSASSPGASPPLVQGQKGGLSGVAPIGTRPIQAGPGSLAKRSTTPLTPSSLSYGFNASDAQNQVPANERSSSAASNPQLADKSVNSLGSWGSSSGVWGSGKNTLAVQPSVWG